MKFIRFEYLAIFTVIIVFPLLHVGCENNRNKYDPESEIKKKNEEYNKTYKDKIDQIKETFSKSNYDSVSNYIDEFKKIYPDSGKTVDIIFYENKLDSIDLVRAKNTIKINYVRSSRPNSVGGVDLEISYTNTSKSTIKYAYFEVSPINAVDDYVQCTMSGRSEIKFQTTGPVKPGQSRPSYWACPWYNSTITRASLTKVQIIYMDGTAVYVLCNNNLPFCVRDIPSSLIENDHIIEYN